MITAVVEGRYEKECFDRFGEVDDGSQKCESWHGKKHSLAAREDHGTDLIAPRGLASDQILYGNDFLSSERNDAQLQVHSSLQKQIKKQEVECEIA